MTPGLEEALRALRMADRDIVAFRKMKDDPDFHFTTTCFHAQQAIEKCMKAVMFEHGILFPPIHDLARLALSLHEHGVVVPCTVDTDIPLISVAEVEKMVDAMRRWSGEAVK